MKLIYTIGVATLTMFTISCAQKKKSETLEINKAEISDVKSDAEAREEDKAEMSYTCIVQKDTRLIELEKKPKRCEVYYTKFGDKAQVAWAESTPSLCSEVYDKIRKNIEDKGFSCSSSPDDEPKQEAKEQKQKEERKSASIGK